MTWRGAREQRLVARQVARQLRQRRTHVLLQHLHGGGPDIGLLAGQHLVADDAEAVEVRADIERLAERLLGAHVVRRAEQHAGLGTDGVAIDRARQAEVDERHRVVLAQHHIRRLQIAVHQPRLVHDLERRGDLRHVVQRLPLTHAALDARLQVPARQVLHRQVLEAGVHAVIVDLHHQRAVHRHDGGVLTLEELAARRLVAQRLAHLQRHVVAALRAGGEIHHRLLRLADPQAQRVAGDHLRVRRGQQRRPPLSAAARRCRPPRDRGVGWCRVGGAFLGRGGIARPAAPHRATYWRGWPGGAPRAARRAAARCAPPCSGARA